MADKTYKAKVVVVDSTYNSANPSVYHDMAASVSITDDIVGWGYEIANCEIKAFRKGSSRCDDSLLTVTDTAAAVSPGGVPCIVHVRNRGASRKHKEHKYKFIYYKDGKETVAGTEGKAVDGSTVDLTFPDGYEYADSLPFIHAHSTFTKDTSTEKINGWYMVMPQYDVKIVVKAKASGTASGGTTQE